jgi:hypothetical protein
MKELFIKGYTEVCSQVPEWTNLTYGIFICVGIIIICLGVFWMFRNLMMEHEG